MIKVYQTVVDIGKGNCMQAAIASMFELELSQVPNFILYDEHIWFNVFFSFLQGIGYEFEGTMHKDVSFYEHDMVNGCIYASVNSRTFKDKTHAVLINSAGRVIHDPNPNELWLGEHIKTDNKLINWYAIKIMKGKVRELWQTKRKSQGTL